jgi:hypothetical protein
MTENILSVWDLIQILGYPLVAYVSWKAGWHNGVTDTVEDLHARGLIELDEEPAE